MESPPIHTLTGRDVLAAHTFGGGVGAGLLETTGTLALDEVWAVP